MKDIQILKQELENGKYTDTFCSLCTSEEERLYQRNKYIQAIDRFCQNFGTKSVEIYSTPGRSEVCGNHTDHQRGMVLAAAVNMDAVAVAAPREDTQVCLYSEGFGMVELDLGNLEKQKREEGTTMSLIRGVAAGMKKKGYQVGGFEACVVSDVLSGSGLSSSAAFEGLIGTILSGLYNEQRLPQEENAKIGQFAENVYFGKPSGLMDQMACCLGGLVYIDFQNVEKPKVRKLNVDFEKFAYALCITDTKGSHADLTDDYAAIRQEMEAVAGFFGKDVLREVDEEEFYEKIGTVREKTGDRAVLRAIHFFEEEKRVLRAVRALEEGNEFPQFLREIRRSGESSVQYLQNIYSNKKPSEQNINIALALSCHLLKDNGVYRVHGGGFAGTVQAFVKKEAVDAYKEGMEKVFGADSCHILHIRKEGGVRVL